jgi:hypothetical protein
MGGKMKTKPEYVEGPEAAERFNAAMRKVLSVSPDELRRRVEAERQQAAMNPHKRGSKPGVLNHVPRSSKPKTGALGHVAES